MVSRIEAGQRRVTLVDLFSWADALAISVVDLAREAAGLWVDTAGRPPSLWRPDDE